MSCLTLLRPFSSRYRPASTSRVILITRSFSSTSTNSSSPEQPATSSIDSLGQATSSIDQLSDFLISQPIQPLSYTATVILATVLVRATTTLPVSIWSRLRINRFERIVLPTFKKFRTNLALRAQRSFLDPAQIAVYQRYLQSQLKQELDRLISVNRCRPWVTIVGSLGIHVPVIYGMTTVLRNACERVTPASPLAIEPSPILGESLLEPDLALALICWAAFLTNVELNASFRYLRRSSAKSSDPSSPSKSKNNASFMARGLEFWTPEKIRSASFLAGIGMMGISSSQPALVLVYWLTSNCFSIVQSLGFIYLDHRYHQNISKTDSKDSLSTPPSNHNDQNRTSVGRIGNNNQEYRSSSTHGGIEERRSNLNLLEQSFIRRKKRNQKAGSSSSLPPIL
ncbi:hypothetical protein MJO28_005103 [Puccinia striiformis f. sp. tritici]|uniref:Uncharacterized protein n=1 Tax=Puccinia striiformis f. sp. tritici TaxID=168172 RepID=A0ACC0ELL1_9BASI|nr:hypothetical protein MJO28_005103 [Puccinia striiformis f. sp. tritici]